LDIWLWLILTELEVYGKVVFIYDNGRSNIESHGNIGKTLRESSRGTLEGLKRDALSERYGVLDTNSGRHTILVIVIRFWG
jgi:hypothetical protein